MVVDTSAIMAIILAEAGSELLASAMLREPSPLISAGTVLELDVVALRRGGPEMRQIMEEIIAASGLITIPVNTPTLRFARLGFERFGKGRGVPPAALNFGDCFAYGLAKAEDAPSLYKGEDFSKTDIKAVRTV